MLGGARSRLEVLVFDAWLFQHRPEHTPQDLAVFDDRATGAEVELPVTPLAARWVEAKLPPVAASVAPGASQELGAVHAGGW